MKTTWRTRAFTLIELLVVIAVIAVLMAILMPALQRAKNQARGIFCQSNTKSLALAWLLYKDDNDDKLVSGHTGDRHWVDNPENNTGVDPLVLKKEAIKRGTLYPYMGKNVNAYHCPADERIRISSQMAFRSYSIAGGMNGVNASGGWNIIPHLKYGTIQQPATGLAPGWPQCDHRGDPRPVAVRLCVGVQDSGHGGYRGWRPATAQTYER